MSEIQAKILAEIQDEFRLIRDELRANDELLDRLLAANRNRIERVAKLDGLMLALAAFGHPAEPEAVVDLSNATPAPDSATFEQATGPETIQTELPVKLSQEERQKEMLKLHPRLEQQLVLAKEALTLADTIRANGGSHAVRLEETSKRLHICADQAYKKLISLSDPAAVFRTCGNDSINVLNNLIQGIMQGRGELMHATSLVSDTAISDLKPFLRRLWCQIQECTPGLYEEFHLDRDKSPEHQKPSGLPETMNPIQKFYRIFARKKDATVINDVIETVVPGYFEIKTNGQKALVSPAWVVISNG